MKGICNRNYLLPGRRKGEMLGAHSLLTEDWLEGGQQITEQACSGAAWQTEWLQKLIRESVFRSSSSAKELRGSFTAVISV